MLMMLMMLRYFCLWLFVIVWCVFCLQVLVPDRKLSEGLLATLSLRPEFSLFRSYLIVRTREHTIRSHLKGQSAPRNITITKTRNIYHFKNQKGQQQWWAYQWDHFQSKLMNDRNTDSQSESMWTWTSHQLQSSLLVQTALHSAWIFVTCV